jgi:hypothetical protein
MITVNQLQTQSHNILWQGSISIQCHTKGTITL